MSTEERLAKQLDNIAGSIIKALESLEKELSEYIDVTNKRLHVLEDKVTKFESLAVVSSKGLVGAVQESNNSGTVKGLAHLSTPSSSPSPTPPKSIQPPVVQPNISSTPSVVQPSVSSPPPAPTIPKVEQPQPTPPVVSQETKLPPVPAPPTYKATLADEKSTTDIPQPPTTDDKKTDKKNGEDKEELMSALKIIDSL